MAGEEGPVTLAFIVRVEFDGRRWLVTLHDLTSGERRAFASFEGCFAALKERSEVRSQARPRLPR